MTIESQTESVVGHDGSAVSSTGAQTLGAVVLAAEVRGDRAAIRYKRDGEIVEMSYRELTQRARRIARGLLALGIEPQDRISILSETRPEWTLVDFGAFCAGATVAPDLPHELAGGVRLRARALRAPPGVLRERGAGSRRSPHVRDACPRSSTSSLLDRRGAGRDDPRRAVRTRPPVADGAVDERVRTIDPRRPRHARLHLGHDRARRRAAC